MNETRTCATATVKEKHVARLSMSDGLGHQPEPKALSAHLWRFYRPSAIYIQRHHVRRRHSFGDESMSEKLLDLTRTIVSAYVANNPVPTDGLPKLISDVAASLIGLSTPAAPEEPKPTPAVNPKRSVFPDYIVCLEDGRKFKSLKRHLMSHYGLTPEQYRDKWELPYDYPMVAPNYSAARSELAKSLGLGRQKAPEPVEEKPVRKRAAKSAAKPKAGPSEGPAEVVSEAPTKKRRTKAKAA